MKRELKNQFKMKDLGPVKHYLGIEVQRTKNEIRLTQTEYATEILKRFGMEDCAPKPTPMDPGIRLDIDVAGNPLAEADKVRYQQAVGSLLYLSLGTRPDIAFAVSILSRFTANPHELHEKALHRVLRYIRGTLDVGITYSKSSSSPIPFGFSDASFAHPIVKEGRRSPSGYIFFMSGGPVSWSSKRQSTVATSSTEAEYIGQFNAAREAIWIRTFLQELGYRDLIKDPLVIKADNSPAQSLSKDPTIHSKAKHLDIAYHWQRQQVERKAIQFEDIPSEDNGADGLTKPLATQLYKTFKDLIQMNEISDPLQM